MVDIRFMAASSRPSGHEQEADGEATSCSRVGQTRHASGRTASTIAAAAMQHHHSAMTVVTSPLAAGAETTLVDARSLLNNPPGPHLRMVVWPRKFRPHLLEKYDGSVNPTKFLQIYITSILVAGGNEAIMANYFPVALTGTSRSWLMSLPPKVTILLGRVVPSVHGQL
jgi:hypothetical protein